MTLNWMEKLGPIYLVRAESLSLSYSYNLMSRLRVSVFDLSQMIVDLRRYVLLGGGVSCSKCQVNCYLN